MTALPLRIGKAWLAALALRAVLLALAAVVELAGAVALAALWPREVSAAAEVQARIGRGTLAVGESTTLEVIVQGAPGAAAEPEFDVPSGIELLGSDRAQNFTWINGRSLAQTVFHYELSPSAPGRYALGPIRVRVGGQIYESGTLGLTVTAAAATRVGGGASPVTLVADVAPSDPYVGQPVLLRVRLVQRATLAEDPDYTPPPTPGFWSERFTDPESYYAQQGSQRVLVTETRARLLPLASGSATVGAATAGVVLSSPGPYADPLAWAGGNARRELTIRSAPLAVAVRVLPRGAPAGFDGAVGSLSVAWSADREQTSEDVPVGVRLDVRGVGNLPLLHTPALDATDFEVFAGTVEDSAGSPGTLAAGRRRFQWTLLPRRLGRLEVPPPAFAWFDPAAGLYRSAALPSLALEVAPPAAAGEATHEIFPAVFVAHPLDPDARPVAPWAWAVAGAALGAALALARVSRRPPADAAERARQHEWLRVVGLSSGAAFWPAADQACAWLEQRGRAVAGLRRDIAASRYGGPAADLEGTRRRVVEELARALPPATPGWPFAVGALALTLAALVLVFAFGPLQGGERGRAAARTADQAGRDGDLEQARRGWQELWDGGARAPGLAARLAWAEVRAGHVGPAAAWVLRGQSEEPRDKALAWVADRVREGGGLGGATPVHWPVRRLEWALAALALALAAGWLWPRPLPSASCLALAIACAVIFPLQGLSAARAARAVLGSVATLEGPDLELSPGQVVTVLRHAGARARVVAGRDIEGWLPVADLIELEGR